jgi:nucleotide-binding universal stress UspA family protein
MSDVIVWATDGSPAADLALPLAIDAARVRGARLLAVHVDELSVSKGGAYEVNVDEDDRLADIRRRLDELGRQGIDTKLMVTTMPSGGAAHAIADAARDAGADLIVVGTRGHGFVKGLLVGSVTHRLLHVAPCPILVVPSANGDAAGG